MCIAGPERRPRQCCQIGLYGWQRMFLIEALPALLMTFVVYYYLTDRPTLATWLQTR
jgi:hypothetical protein